MAAMEEQPSPPRTPKQQGRGCDRGDEEATAWKELRRRSLLEEVLGPTGTVISPSQGTDYYELSPDASRRSSLDLDDIYQFDHERLAQLVRENASTEELAAAVSDGLKRALVERLNDDAAQEFVDDHDETQEERPMPADVSGAMTPIADDEEGSQPGSLTPGRRAAVGGAALNADVLQARLDECKRSAAAAAAARRRSTMQRRRSTMAARRDSVTRRASIESAVQNVRRRSLAALSLGRPDGAPGDGRDAADTARARRLTLTLEKAGDILEEAGVNDEKEAEEKLDMLQRAMQLGWKQQQTEVRAIVDQHLEAVQQMTADSVSTIKHSLDKLSQEVSQMAAMTGAQKAPLNAGAPPFKPTKFDEGQLTLREQMELAIQAAYQRQKNAHFASSEQYYAGSGQGPMWTPGYGQRAEMADDYISPLRHDEVTWPGQGDLNQQATYPGVPQPSPFSLGGKYSSVPHYGKWYERGRDHISSMQTPYWGSQPCPASWGCVDWASSFQPVGIGSCYAQARWNAPWQAPSSRPGLYAAPWR